MSTLTPPRHLHPTTERAPRSEQSPGMPPRPVPLTVAAGDGIGPEITEATLRIIEAAGASLSLEHIEVGAAVYERGHTAGIGPEAWDSLRRTGVLLKGPITTPSGSGYKSLNVTLRKTLGLFANVRPARAYHPFVKTKHPEMDVVVIRENEEDTYAGIEHRQTRQVTQCLKLITRPGCERIVRYAFEYARAHGRRRVTCLVKDNIHKLTDGLFSRVFAEIAPEYPDIEAERMIIDIGAARLANAPERFDVVVTPNLYGDIVSDITAEISGSVGLVGTANVGPRCAMFEAVHGSAPDIAGQGIANPSGMLLAAVQMLVHVGQAEVAERVHNAWLATIEDGIHTADIFDPKTSREKVGTEAFADALIARLGMGPRELPAPRYAEGGLDLEHVTRHERSPETKQLVGVDVFIDWEDEGRGAEPLGRALNEAASEGLRLKMITNRGVKVYPEGVPETFCTDHWRCRFVPANDDEGLTSQRELLRLLTRLVEAGHDVVKTENLYTFDGERGYSLGQGE